MFYRVDQLCGDEKPSALKEDLLFDSQRQFLSPQSLARPLLPVDDPTKNSSPFRVNLLWASAPQDSIAQTDTVPGDVILRSQKDVDDFVEKHKDEKEIVIKGNLELNGEDIRDLSGLQETIVVIEGDFRIVQTGLEFLELNNLKKVHSITIIENAHLKRISGFAKLQIIEGSLSIRNNPQLTEINAFSELFEVSGDFLINHNPVLKSVATFIKLAWRGRGKFFMCSDGGIFDLSDNPQLDQQSTGDLKLRLGLPTTVERVVYTVFEERVFRSQQDIDDFMSRYENEDNIVIRGPLTIEGPAIRDLSGLAKTVAIQTVLDRGDCEIEIRDTNLENLRGLDRLASADDLEIISCHRLQTIELPHLRQTNDFAIRDNNSLETIECPYLKRSKGISITGNDALTTISDFAGLQYCVRLRIISNNSLESISGFPTLNEVSNEFSIHDNPNLKRITGFKKFKIFGLKEISDYSFHFYDNPQLAQTDIDRLKSQLGLIEKKN